MQLAHRIALDGVQLDEIDPRIIIKGIEGGAGKESVTSVSTGLGDGTRITGKRRDSVDVNVRFAMNIRRDAMEERAAVLEAVNAWAVRGGWATISYKPERMLLVDEVTTPGEGDLWKRLDEYTITFRAHAVPYWQQATPAQASSGTGLTGSGTITAAGSARTVADVTVENRSGAVINSLSVAVGDRGMTFQALNLGGNQKLVIDHPVVKGKCLIRARIGGRSVLGLRTENSDDDFDLAPGVNAFAHDAQRACRMIVSVRGRFV